MTTTQSKIVTAEEFEELLAGYPTTSGVLISNDIFDTTRWTEIWCAVWSETHTDGIHYFRVNYDRPSTEYQEGSEEEYDPSNVSEVFPQEITITKYFSKKELDKLEG